ncbi:hypothetical protein BD293_4359 [Roseinatronobacter monicus]|uniref:Uncharacterized protein n=1 Tax=Roseinatronobacter monicus TaxID=393481 RepID=A0A543K3P2_9RHOB|nr:hypothetical protein BD293_4359 [Roseinatronobacter monicus]
MGMSEMRPITSASHAWGSISLSLAVQRVDGGGALTSALGPREESQDFRPRATPRR